MKQKNKYYFLISIVSFTLFLLYPFNVLAVSHENDIEFSWISPLICNDLNPRDINIDDTLNATIYNSVDYLEHTYPFDNETYGTYYLNHTYPLGNPTYYYKAIVPYENQFYCFSSVATDDIIVFNRSLEIIDTITNPFTSYTYIYGGATDGNYIYLVVYTFYGGSWDYRVISVDFNLTLVDTLITTTASFQDIAYYNSSLWITRMNPETLYRYDLEGNELESHSLLELGNPNHYKLACYRNSLFLYNTSNKYVYEYDVLGTFDYSEHIESYSFFFDEGISIATFHFYNDLIYYGYNPNYVGVITMDFEQQDCYDVIDYYPNYPNSYGLFDSINNINLELTHLTNPIGHYNASYSFFNDANGNQPLGWIIDDTYGVIEIYGVEQEHKKVIELSDTDPTGNNYIEFEYEFTRTSGIIDFWCLAKQTTATMVFGVKSDLSVDSIYYYLRNNGKVSYYDGIHHQIYDYSANEYNHFSIVFNTSEYSLYFNGISVVEGETDFNGGSPTSFEGLWIHTWGSEQGNFSMDAIGFDWLDNYTVNQNWEYGIENNGFHNEIIFMTESYQEITSIECRNGTYYINDVTTDYNVFFNDSEYVIDTWSLNLSIDQILENGTLFLYNETNDLLYNESFDTLVSGNIKYIVYIQHYQNSSHFLNVNNFYISSNDTYIIGDNGFVSYALDLIDTTVWSFDANSLLNLTGNGIYRIYVSNDTYENQSSELYQISNWIELRNTEIELDVSRFDYTITNPYLIIETLNGHYLLDKIEITTTTGNIILADDRGFTYSGTFTYSNINTINSYFYIDNDALYFQIIFESDDLEYMQLSFDIENIVNLNYRILYTTYLNTSDASLIAEMNLKHTDASEMQLDIEYLLNSDTEILEQELTTSFIEFFISDNDLLNNENRTILGYIEAFTFNYLETIIFAIFVDNMLLMLLPIIVILALTMTFSYTFRDKRKNEVVNKSMFFPIFVISSIIVFILGMFDFWILFVIVIATIVYLIKKRDDFR